MHGLHPQLELSAAAPSQSGTQQAFGRMAALGRFVLGAALILDVRLRGAAFLSQVKVSPALALPDRCGFSRQ